ncbi:hypothetical protein QBC41DRAFT_23443 [Cercophora samala]|uniref:BHLH domain-containing protein n=1 Tax=Cercophora samala TaxID=330535 RepID=A0AA40D815_9PEZI|nr:hypothetical protein QBC41DRAFT_23443 [Cercophora samala]
MEQTSQWIQSDHDQLHGGRFGHEQPSQPQHRLSTSSHEWAYGQSLSNNLDYHDPNLHRRISNPADLSSYQQSITDDRLPSPTCSHLGTSFDQDPLAFEGRWARNSPISPPVPYGDIACTLSSANNIQTSPIILSPGDNDHWTYQPFPMSQYHVSLSQPDSPLVATNFDPSHAADEAYFASNTISDIPSSVRQGIHTRVHSSPTIHVDIETTSTQRQRNVDRASGSGVQGIIKASGKGQLPSPSTRAKSASQAKGSKMTSSVISSTIQPQRQPSLSGPGLRTAPRRVKRITDEALPKPGESLEDQRARENHNQVEKEYRNRLHKGFEELLEALYALPVEELVTGRRNDGAVVGEEGDHDDEKEHMAIIGALLYERTGLGLPTSRRVGGKGKRKHRRISKAEVLHYTCRVLKSMGDGNQKLKEEVEHLKSLHDISTQSMGSR